MTDRERWIQVIDRARPGEAIHVDVPGTFADLADRIGTDWAPKPNLERVPEFPNGYGPPPRDEEWMRRRVVIVRLSKEENVYKRQEIGRTIYEIKPEVILP
jgi:hypothetical protein